MKLTFAKAAAALSLAAAATFAVPMAAQADTYPPADAASTSTTTVPAGGSFGFFVEAGIFVPGELVTIYLTGEGASGASMGFASFAVETAMLGEATADADGSFDTTITLPADASGTYTVMATSDSVPAGVSATVTVASSTGGLPATGLDSNSLLGLWVGGGALVLAGGAVAVGAAVYRQRKQAA